MADPFDILKAKKEKILADAQQALLDAQKEAAAVDSDLHELERLQSLADKYGLKLTPAQTPPEDEGPEHIPAAVLVASGNHQEPAYAQAIRAAENVVRAIGQPTDFTTIFEGVVRQGVRLAGKRPQSTLSAFLAHEKSTLESIRRGTYWFKGEPVPRLGGIRPYNRAAE